MDRKELYEQISITSKGNKEANEIREGLRMLPTETLKQIAHAEKTMLGITCTFGEPMSNGYYNIPSSCTHVFDSQGGLYFAMPNHCLIIPKGKPFKFNLNK